MTTLPNTAAARLVAALEAHGVQRVFCVPGESFLGVLDALRDSGIDTVVARQEGGAAMMAEADAKLSGNVGVCMVTRGPGATNASAGVHVAQQDSTPLLLCIGQVASTMLGRDAFQEVDYQAFYGGMAKAVLELSAGQDAARLVQQAVRIALEGRPGPVVLVLPEDLQGAVAPAALPLPDPLPAVLPAADDVNVLARLLAAAERPLVVAGGSGWNAAGAAALQAFVEDWQLPVAVTFRRQQLVDNEHGHYAGDFGIGVNPRLRGRLEHADLVIVLGSRFSEVPSQGYELLEQARAGQQLVHVHVDALQRFAHAGLRLRCHPQDLLATLPPAPPGLARGAAVQAARADFDAWTAQPAANAGSLQMGEVIQTLRAALPADAVVTNGAGNYGGWLQRFYRYRGFGTQVAPTSGSMGYGLPAAIAARLRYPDREVVCLAGDGCFQMTCQEFGSAAQLGLALTVIVVDNSQYGTIRMHQARRFPRRVHATSIVNPDFAAWARAYGAFAATVRTTAEFGPALTAARASGGLALLHLLLDPDAIAPGTSLAALEPA